MQVKLVCQDSLAPGGVVQPREIVIDQFPCELGRRAEVAVRIDDRWLSRRHCCLDVSGGRLVVRDLGSRHGTFVNGQRVSECNLLPGDKLCIGLMHFVAEYSDAKASDSQLALHLPLAPAVA